LTQHHHYQRIRTRIRTLLIERLPVVVVVVIFVFQGRYQTHNAKRYKRGSANLTGRTRSWSSTSSLVE
jgi:hypothetical protein